MTVAYPSHYECTKRSFRQEKIDGGVSPAFMRADGSTPKLHDIPTTVGWCNQCQLICFVEDLDAALAESRLAQASLDLEQLRSAPKVSWRDFALLLLGDGWRGRRKDWEAELAQKKANVERAQATLNYMRSLNSPPRCLRCGGDDVVPSRLLGRINARRFESPLTHPRCGGEIKHVTDFSR